MINPLISIIVPVYKAEKTLCRCVDSLLSQLYKNIEIVLVDDGSPDLSPIMCDNYAKEHNCIKVIHILNGGVSNARNVGIKSSAGEYLCFVDSDDYVDIDYVQNFVDDLSPSTDLVFQGINEVHGEGKIVSKKPDAKVYEYDDILNGISDINKFSMFGYVCNKLYRRSIIEKHNLSFRTDISISEDRIFALQYMAFVKEMRTVNKSAYHYILQNSGLTLRQRSYEEIKIAADENLRVALTLLQFRKSDRFLNDTKRMYAMAATGYLLALFKQKYPFRFRSRAISEFQKNYIEWLSLYTPVSTDQKFLYKALAYNATCCSMFMQTYFFIKKLRHGKIA